MKRLALNLLTALSLLLFVAVCFLWSLSYARPSARQFGQYRITSSAGTVSIDNRFFRFVARRTELQRLQAVEQYKNYLSQGGTTQPAIQPWGAAIRARASAPPVAQVKPVDVRVPFFVLAGSSLVSGVVSVWAIRRRSRLAERRGRCA